MYIRDCMKTPVVTVEPDSMLDDASRMMFEKHIRRLPVVENGRLVGLVTRDRIRNTMPLSVQPMTISRPAMFGSISATAGDEVKVPVGTEQEKAQSWVPLLLMA